jgi:hypothetical protein
MQTKSKPFVFTKATMIGDTWVVMMIAVNVTLAILHIG